MITVVGGARSLVTNESLVGSRVLSDAQHRQQVRVGRLIVLLRLELQLRQHRVVELLGLRSRFLLLLALCSIVLPIERTILLGLSSFAAYLWPALAAATTATATTTAATTATATTTSSRGSLSFAHDHRALAGAAADAGGDACESEQRSK